MNSTKSLSAKEAGILRQVARVAIGEELGEAHQQPFDWTERLRAHRASFVTLTIAEQLRGCVGSVAAYRPLHEDVIHNAKAAAFLDTRFSPLSRREFEVLDLEISILSTPERIVVGSESELLRSLAPGIHGLILQEGRYRATFLPAVWETLPSAKEFLAHLKLKAGLPKNYWSPTLEFLTYTVEKI